MNIDISLCRDNRLEEEVASPQSPAPGQVYSTWSPRRISPVNNTIGTPYTEAEVGKSSSSLTELMALRGWQPKNIQGLLKILRVYELKFYIM